MQDNDPIELLVLRPDRQMTYKILVDEIVDGSCIHIHHSLHHIALVV